MRADPAGTRTKRPGRLRRWVVRPLLWTVAILAIALFVAQQLVDTRWAQDLARRLLVERLSSALARPVELDQLRFELLPFSLELRGLVIHGPETSDPPFVQVPWLAVDAELADLRRGLLRFHRIRAERPRIFLDYLGGGVNNLPKARGGSARRPFEVFIDRLEVDRGEIVVDQQSIRLTVEADTVQARMHGAGDLRLAGQVVSRAITVRLPNAEPMTVALSARGLFAPGQMTVDRARIGAPGLALTASGQCSWGRRQPDKKCLFQVAGRGTGTNLAELGYFRRLEGAFEVDGTIAWRPGSAGWRGRVSAAELVVWDRQLSDVSATLAADRYGVRSRLERVGYAGGEVSGTIDIELREADQPVTLDLELRDLILDRWLADQSIPLDGLAARVDGGLRYRFPRREPWSGDGAGEIGLAVDPSQPGLGVSGSSTVEIESGRLHTDAVRLRGPGQSALASGWYDFESRRGVFDYDLATTDVARISGLLPLAPHDEGRGPPWLPTTGEGSLRGRLFVEPGRSSTAIELELERVATPTVTAGRATGALRVSKSAVERLDIRLARAASELEIQGRIPYRPGGDAGDLVMTVRAREWPSDQVRPWVPFAIPLDGRVSGRLQLTVTAGGASIGRAEVSVDSASAIGVPIGGLAGDLSWNRQRVILERLTVTAPAGRATAHGTIGLDDEGLDLRIAAADLDLTGEPLHAYLPRPDLAGLASLRLRVRGTRSRPLLDLEAELSETTLGGRRLADTPSRFALSWDGAQLHATGRLIEAIAVEGGGPLDRSRAALSFSVVASDLGRLVELLAPVSPGVVSGTLQGRLEIAGALDGPSPPAVDLSLDDLRLTSHGRTLVNLEPVAVSFRRDAAHISSLYLGEPDTASDLFLSGRAGYASDAPLDLRLQSTLSTTWLQLLIPQVELEGSFDLLAKVGGTLADPHLDGQGQIRHASLMIPSTFPHALEALEGVLLFYRDAVVVDHLSAKLAGGRLTAHGRTALGDRDAAETRLQVLGRGLRIRYPEGWLLEGDTDLTVAIYEGGVQVTGRADLARLQYLEDLPVGFAQFMEGVFQRRRLEAGQEVGWLSAVDLNVALEARDAVVVDNNLADLTGTARLSLRGTLGRPVIFGQVEIAPGSRLVYNATEYAVERGRVHFADPLEIQPEVDLVASTRVRDIDVTLTLSGPLDRMDVVFSSEPPLPDLEVFRLLASGGDERLEEGLLSVPQAGLADEEPSTSAATFLYGQAASVIGDRVSNLFGFDRFRIDPLTGSGDNLSRARISVGERLSKDVFLTYSIDPSSTEDLRLQIEWQIDEGLVLVLTQNGDGSYSADARWERSF